MMRQILSSFLKSALHTILNRGMLTLDISSWTTAAFLSIC